MGLQELLMMVYVVHGMAWLGRGRSVSKDTATVLPPQRKADLEEFLS